MPIVSGTLGANGLVAKATLTPAQIQGMLATPLVLVAAPGVGAALIVDACMFTTTAAFTAFGGAFACTVDVTTETTPPTSVYATSFSKLAQALKGNGDSLVYESFSALTAEVWTGPQALINNAPFILYAGAAAPTGGSGNVTAYTSYSVVSL